jgi:hypothetical protein
MANWSTVHWRDPRLAPWWTGCSVRRRLLAHLTEQAGSARISPGGHLRSDLVSELVVVWTRLGVRVTRGRPTRKQRRYALRDEGEGTLRLMQCVLRVSRRYALISTSRARRPQGHHPSQCSALTSCPCARECGTCVCACACTCMRVRVCEDVSPRRCCAGCRGTTPAMLCFDQLPVCVLVLRVRVCV